MFLGHRFRSGLVSLSSVGRFSSLFFGEFENGDLRAHMPRLGKCSPSYTNCGKWTSNYVLLKLKPRVPLTVLAKTSDLGKERNKDMIVTTTPSVEGRKITAYHGVVVGEAIMGANIVRDFFASVTDVIGRRSGVYEG